MWWCFATYLLGSHPNGLKYFDVAVNVLSDVGKNQIKHMRRLYQSFQNSYIPVKKPSRSLIHSVSDSQMQLAICRKMDL